MPEILILEGIRAKYAIRLQFKTREEMQEVIEVLKPLGYTFRKPSR